MHAFPDRAALLDYEAALQHATTLDAALEVCSHSPQICVHKLVLLHQSGSVLIMGGA